MTWMIARSWFEDELFWFESEVLHKGMELYVVGPTQFVVNRVVGSAVSKVVGKDGWIGWDDVIGGAFVAWGAAMLIPGPIDVAAGALGMLVFKHPIGAAIGVIAYNLFALTVMAIGGYLIAMD